MADGGESAQELRRRNFTLPLVLAEIRRRTKAAQHDRVEVVKGF
jgi:hypothetical protein